MPPTDRYVSETNFYVRYAETDAMGIVHHSMYIVYFEEARSHFSRVLGANYADFEQSGYWLTVAEVRARYAAPARYGQQIAARCWIEDLKSRAIVFGYEIVDCASDTIHVTGQSHHVCITHEGRVARIPDTWAEAMRRGLSPA
ncbi:MAG: acyl-CoA thioesterase [Chloroflexi bacterium]|nr:acyl-CoA thioesterase [Chloroflexota bacterium]